MDKKEQEAFEQTQQEAFEEESDSMRGMLRPPASLDVWFNAGFSRGVEWLRERIQLDTQYILERQHEILALVNRKGNTLWTEVMGAVDEIERLRGERDQLQEQLHVERETVRKLTVVLDARDRDFAEQRETLSKMRKRLLNQHPYGWGIVNKDGLSVSVIAGVEWTGTDQRSVERAVAYANCVLSSLDSNRPYRVVRLWMEDK